MANLETFNSDNVLGQDSMFFTFRIGWMSTNWITI